MFAAHKRNGDNHAQEPGLERRKKGLVRDLAHQKKGLVRDLAHHTRKKLFFLS